MIKFVTPTRYDETLAKQGIDIAVEEEGVHYGTFKVKCYDPFNPLFKVERERYERVHKADIKALKDTQEKNIHQFVHMAMIGWDGIEGEDGPVPFTKDNAFAFLTQTDIGIYVFGELITQASTVSNFKAVDEDDTDPLASADEVSGN